MSAYYADHCCEAVNIITRLISFLASYRRTTILYMTVSGVMSNIFLKRTRIVAASSSFLIVVAYEKVYLNYVGLIESG